MAIKGVVTIDQVWLLEVDADPSSPGNGVDAPIGSIATFDGDEGFWQKKTVSSTGWVRLANELKLRYSLLAPYSDTTTVGNNTITLDNTSKSLRFFLGTVAGQILKLPDARTLDNGWTYEFWNLSDKTIDLRLNTGTSFSTISQSAYAKVILQDNSTQAGTWSIFQIYVSGIASGVLNYNLVSSTPFSTTSTSDVVITGFSLTPQSGTYACFLNAASYLTTTPKAHWWSFYKAGSQISDSERTQDTAHSNQNMVDTTMTITQFTGSQAMDVRVRTTNGTLTMNARSMLLTRLGV